MAAWQLSRDVRTLAYKLLAKPEVARDFQFRDQLKDAARSAPRNIAEGFARYKHKEFAQFVRIAKGSMGEVLDHFIDAVDNSYLTPTEFTTHEHACKKALKAINGPEHRYALYALYAPYAPYVPGRRVYFRA